MAADDRVLIAIMNNPRDLRIARQQHWYRIPVSSADKWLKRHWPPKWLAFYQTKIFGDEAFAVNHYAHVADIRQAYRWQLFDDQPRNERGMKRYYQLILDPLQRLPKPILSRRRRRIVFIPTTWRKFIAAVEGNDLYHESPLEDRLWAEFKRLQIWAERQFWISVHSRSYSLDFAIYCVSGKLDVETDGDTWHSDPARIPKDNLRYNDLQTGGWKVLRFNTYQIREEMTEYCLPTVVENIGKLGGVDEGRLASRRIHLLQGKVASQLSLFEQEAPPYDIDTSE